MEKASDNFELDFEKGKIQVHRLLVGTQTIFRILFSDKRPPAEAVSKVGSLLFIFSFWRGFIHKWL